MDNTPKYISVDSMPAGPELEALAAEMNMGWSKSTSSGQLINIEQP